MIGTIVMVHKPVQLSLPPSTRWQRPVHPERRLAGWQVGWLAGRLELEMGFREWIASVVACGDL